jgi:hypothetical protein
MLEIWGKPSATKGDVDAEGSVVSTTTSRSAPTADCTGLVPGGNGSFPSTAVDAPSSAMLEIWGELSTGGKDGANKEKQKIHLPSECTTEPADVFTAACSGRASTRQHSACAPPAAANIAGKPGAAEPASEEGESEWGSEELDDSGEESDDDF